MFLLFTVGTLLVSCSSSSGPTYTAAIQEGQTAAREMLSQNRGSAIAIALVNRDRVVWTESFGFADQEKGIAPSDTTMFSMASASKMFAAVAVMQLVEKWNVDLDKPFFSYVNSFSMADSRYRNITVRMLLNHSSSLPGTDYRNVQTTSPRSDYLDQVLESLSHERLKADPGYTNVYCNDGFTLIEALVRAVTGKSYPQFVQDEIFGPLGMSHTRFALEPFADGTFAKAYTNGIPQPQDFLNALASGGAYSTPSDMARIARMFLGGGSFGNLRILSPESVSAMAEDQTKSSFHPARSEALAFGLGWDTVLQPGLLAEGVRGWLKGGDTELGHYGVAFLIAPDEGLAVIVMGASGFGSTAATAVAERVMLRALAETGRISGFPKPLAKVRPAPAPVPDGLLAGIAGVYAGEAGLFRLEPQSDGSLALMMGLADPAISNAPPLAWSRITLLTYRTDGTFAADSNPLDTLRVVSAGGTQFLIRHKPDGYGHYLDDSEFGQRVTGTGGTLSNAWSARLGNQWLLVNDIPESVYWPRSDPRLRIAEIPEVSGRIALFPCGGSTTILDPSSLGDVLAGMMLPTGRDIDDLDVILKSDGEWMRYGSYLHRPLSTVPMLSSGITTVPIGPEGYAEWRSVAAASGPVALSMVGVRAWSMYGPDFTLLGSGGAGDKATLPAGTGRGYLQLYGTKGGRVIVTVP
jgi:CubicO group peptidase (beta-lactamase class C family)